ncbi:hypothetical protein DMENIID0001_047690 [Sergentomyia squamirostris]
MNSLLGGKIIFLKKNGINRSIYSTQGSAVRFGKNLKCQFRLKSADALDVHCKIVAGKSGKISIVNYSEDHPVLVNERRMGKKKVLKSGDNIEILGNKFQWEYQAVSLDDSKMPRASAGTAGPSSLEKKRMCRSEPGRKQKLIRMSQKMTVSILTSSGRGRGRIYSDVHDDQSVKTELSVLKNAEKTEMTEVTSPDIEDKTVVDTVLDVSKSLYQTPLEVTLEATLTPSRATNQTVNLIDLNTPAPNKASDADFGASDTSDLFKTPLKPAGKSFINMKTPSATVEVPCPASVEFKGLAQSTPIDGGKLHPVRMEPFTKNNSTIIEVDGSATVISIEDSAESTSGEKSEIESSLVTPKRLLRSATKADSAKLQQTPRSAKKLEVDFTTPKSSTRVSKRAVTSLRKPTGRSSKLNTSDTTGERARPTVSQLHHLMTMENLMNISSEDSSPMKENPPVVDKENTIGEEDFKTPQRSTRLTNRITSSAKKQNLSLMKSGKVEKVRSPLNNVENLMASPKTPKITTIAHVQEIKRSLENELTNISGKKELSKTPSINNATMEMKDVEELVKDVPEEEASIRLAGIRELLKTPGKSDATADLRGIREMLKDIPEEEPSIRLAGIRELLKSPGKSNATADLRGIREMLKDIPEKEASIRLAGIRELLKTPGKSDATADLRGIREMLKDIPEEEVSMRLSGIRELLKSPTDANKTVNLHGVRELFRGTSNNEASMRLAGIKDLLKSPKDSEESVNFTGVKELMAEPKPSTSWYSGMKDLFEPEQEVPEKEPIIVQEMPKEKTIEIDFESSSSSEHIVEVTNSTPSMDELFNSLSGAHTMPSVKRTYSRKESPNKKALEDEDKEKGINEWIDSIVSTPADAISARRANNTQQVLSDKYSNVTPSGSKAEINETPKEPEEINAVDDDQSGLKTPIRAAKGRVASLRQKAITQSSNRSLNINEKDELSQIDMKFHSTPIVRPGGMLPVSPSLTDQGSALIDDSKQDSARRTLRNRTKINEPEEQSVSNVALLDNTPTTAERPKRGRPAKSQVPIQVTTAEEVSFVVPQSTPRRGRRKAETLMVESKPVLSPEKRPRRGRAASVRTEDQAEVSKDTLAVPEEKPLRGRKKTVQSDVEKTPQEDKPKRGRIASVKIDDVSKYNGEVPEEKPRRGRAASVRTEDQAEVSKDTLAVPEEKPRRGRKKTVQSDVENTPQEDKPKRGRIASVKTDDVSKNSAVVPEEKPRRGRKKIVQSDVESSPVVERPRRGRLASAKSQEENEATLESSVEPRRRGRRAAVKDADKAEVVEETSINQLKRKPRAAAKKVESYKETDNSPAVLSDEKKPRGRKAVALKKSDTEVEDEEEKPPEQPGRRGRKKKDDPPVLSEKKPRRGRAAATTEDETEEKEVSAVVQEKPRRGKRKIAANTEVNDSTKKAVSFSGDVVVNTPPLKRGQAAKVPLSDAAIKPPAAKRGRKAETPIPPSSTDSDASDNAPPRRNLRSRKV